MEQIILDPESEPKSSRI